jgi:protein subunit release factor A
MEEIHLTKKDFKIEWYSGTGAGGQHRNKHMNCCRITHIETGIMCQGTESRSRETNKQKAFERLSKKLFLHFTQSDKINTNDDVIRNYNKPRDEVHDKKSGLKKSYRDIVEKNDIKEMIQSRWEYMSTKEI